MNRRKAWYLLVLAALLLGLVPTAVAGATADWRAKVHPLVLDRLAREDTADFHVVMTAQADVSAAAALESKVEKTAYVFATLRRTAASTQAPLLQYLQARGVSYESMYIYNVIRVTGTMEEARWLASRGEVARIVPPPEPVLDPLFKTMAPQAIEWNILRVHADHVWQMGCRGEGMVVGGNDTGVDYLHPALIDQYRGNLGGGNFDHNYNWWNGIGDPAPHDEGAHGTHTMGTMVGDDGGANQIGVAPRARWIACNAFGNADPVTCFQFFLAPWDLNGQHPDPSKAPDAINNSWYDTSGYDYRPIIQNLTNAGVAVVLSAGNAGPGCNTITNPSYVPEVITVGAFAQGDTIADFSSRGPSDYYSPGFPYLKPEVAAPGVNVRSSVPGGRYEGGWNGTSMAAPHATGLVALMWGAAPCLQGNVPLTKQIIMETAESLVDTQCPPFVDHPNDVWGWGILDTYAAVRAATDYCGASGHLDGHVYDATTMTPIDGAQLSAVRADGLVRTALTPGSGYYTLTLFVDTYTVTASAFGYLSEVVTGVEIFTDSVTTRDLYLQLSPRYVVSGTVVEAGSNAPLLAEVSLPRIPIAPVWTDPATGFYSVTLPAGDYTFLVQADIHQSLERRVAADHDQTQSWAMLPRPCLLLVDDDQNEPDVRSFYTEALDAIGILYDVWDVETAGNPTAMDLTGYPAVAWFTGRSSEGTFTMANELAVGAHLDRGGSFFLSSQDYLYEFYVTRFARNYLHIRDFNDVGQTTVTGQGPYAGLGPYILNYPFANYSDEVIPDITGTVAFQGDRGSAAVAYDGSFKTVFLGFPLEAIPELADRGAVMQATVSLFGGCVTRAGAVTGRVTHEYYGTPIAGATVTAAPGLEATTDPNGDYRMGLATGSYDLTAGKAGYTTAVVTGVVVFTNSVTLQDITLNSPVIQVEPGQLRAGVAPDEQVTLTLTISNPGALDLTWQIAEGTAHIGVPRLNAAPTTSIDVPRLNAAPTTSIDVPRLNAAPAASIDVPRLNAAPTTSIDVPRLNAAPAASADVPWLSVAPTASVAPAGSSLDVVVTLDAAAPYNVPGEYTALLAVQHDDPERGAVTVPVTMSVLAVCLPVYGADFGWAPYTPTVGQPITFTGAATGTLPISYTWEMGDGAMASGAWITHTYTATGAYVVVMTATNCGGTTTRAIHEVQVAPAPCVPVSEVWLSWLPLSPTAGQALTLTAGAEGDLPITFTWDLGDSAVGSGAWVTHTYAAAGAYTVTVAARNECGYGTASGVIVVVERPVEGWKVFLPVVLDSTP